MSIKVEFEISRAVFVFLRVFYVAELWNCMLNNHSTFGSF